MDSDQKAPALEPSGAPCEFAVHCTDGKDLKFKGWRLASLSEASGRKSRWRELELYRTEGGNFVCVTKGCSNNLGEVTRSACHLIRGYELAVRDGMPVNGKALSPEAIADQVKLHFGSSDLAKELYESLGIEHVQEIE